MKQSVSDTSEVEVGMKQCFGNVRTRTRHGIVTVKWFSKRARDEYKTMTPLGYSGLRTGRKNALTWIRVAGIHS